MAKDKAFTVSNIGGQPSGTPAASVTNNGIFSPAYSIGPTSCTAPIPPASSCFVTVRYFASLAAQTWTGTLTVIAIPGGTVTAAVSGSS